MKILNREGIIRMGGRSQGGGGVSVGGGSGSVAGLASESWVEENYISKAFFNRLFTIHSASSVIDPNDPDEEQTIDSIEALVGLWTEQYLSALGQGSGGGGGGGITLNDPLDAINSAGLSDPVTAGSALVWYGGAWTYSPSARLQVAGLNSSAAVSVTGSVTATSFVRQGGTSAMFLKADGSVDTTVYAAQDWVNQNFITIAFFETLFNAVDANGTKVNANTTTGIDSIKAMFGFWTNQYLSALGQGSGGGGGGVTLNQPLSSINSAGLGAPSVSGSTLVWNGTTWTYSSSIGDTKNTAGSSAQPSGVQLYLIGASAQATWGVTYSNSGCYISSDGHLYSGGSRVLTSGSSVVQTISVNSGTPISPTNGNVNINCATATDLANYLPLAGDTMTGNIDWGAYYKNSQNGWNDYTQGSGLSILSSNVEGTGSPYTFSTALHVSGLVWYQLCFERGNNTLLYRGGNESGVQTGGWKTIATQDWVTSQGYTTSDTKNTAGAGTLPTAGTLYLVGAPNYDSDWQQTYTNSDCYISSDGHLYSGGLRVLTIGSSVVQTISVNSGTPISPTNGNVNINCATATDLANYVALSASEQVITSTIGSMTNGVVQFYRAQNAWSMIGFANLSSNNVKQRLGYIGFDSVDNLLFYNAAGTSTYKIYHAGNFTSSVVTGALGFTPAASSDLANYYEKENWFSLTHKTNTSASIIFEEVTSTINYCHIYIGSRNSYHTNDRPLVLQNGYGNVGIGIAAPATKLEVSGYVTATGYKVPNYTGGFLKADGSVDTSTYVSSSALDSYYQKQSSFNIPTAVSAAAVLNIAELVVAGGANGSHIYVTSTNSSYTDSRPLILQYAYGNVGIGITKPSEKLTVSGNVKATSFIKTDGTSTQFLKADGSVDSTSYATSDTLNTAGATAQPNSVIYLVGAGSYNSTYAVTYTNSGCYISADGYLYSGGVKVLTSTSGLITTAGGTITGESDVLILKNNAGGGISLFLDRSSSRTGWRMLASGGNFYVQQVISGASTNALIIKETSQGGDATLYGNTIIHSGNIGSQSVNYATSAGSATSAATLTTPRQIWGNQFDGSAAISGDMSGVGTINGAVSITSGNSTNPLLNITRVGSSALDFISIYVTATHRPLVLQKDAGNVGIGVEPSYKLHVGGALGVDTSVTCHGLSVTSASGSTGSASIAYDLNVGNNAFITGTACISGNLGVGTDSPAFKMDVVGNAQFGVNTNNAYKVRIGSSSTSSSISMCDNSGTSRAIVGLSIDSNNNVNTSFGYGLRSVSGSHTYIHGNTIAFNTNANATSRMRIESDGKVGIGVQNTSGYLLQVNGAAAGTSWTNLSDMRQKNYIEDESIELWQVAGAPLFKFTWKNVAFGTDLHVGSSAQYWQTIVPEAVTIDGLGNLGLQYDVVALLAAITTAKKVQEHEKRIEELERENKVLWNMIASLKAA